MSESHARPLLPLVSPLLHRSMGERIVQAARLAAVLHLSSTTKDALHPQITIGKDGPSIRRSTGPDRALAA